MWSLVLAGCVVGVFAVASIWLPIGAMLALLVVIALAGGAVLGKLGMILVPVTTMVIVVRAEIISTHPVRLQTFLLGVVLIIIALGAAAFSGSFVRLQLRKHSGSGQSDA